MGEIRGKRLSSFLIIILALPFFFFFEVQAHRGLATPPPPAVYDVTRFGANGNGKPLYRNGDSMNGVAMMKAWQKACHCSKGPTKVVIPKGNYVVAEVIFGGPCNNPVTVELQGNLIADPDVSQFSTPEFIVFQNVDGVIFTGPGTIDLTNQVPKSSNSSKNDNVDFSKVMPTIKMSKVKNIMVEGITSVNPASYHVFVVESQKINIRNVKFNNNAKSPVAPKNTNTNNGIYISGSNLVSVSNSQISVADDCITIAPGSTNVSINALTCVAGQGISIGSKPLTAQLDIKGVIVKDCLFKGSEFGARIIPGLEDKLSLISDIQLVDLVMEGVQNPILIDQQLDRLNLGEMKQSIQAKIANVEINNIKGTTTTRNALSFLCSPDSPCEDIQVGNIDLSFIGNTLGKVDNVIGKNINVNGLNSLVNCLNAKVVFNGKNDGLCCGLLQ